MNETPQSAETTDTYYDKYWDRSNQTTWTPDIRPWPDRDFEKKMGRFRGCASVLDVGCGDATTYHRQLIGIVGELHALEGSRHAAEQARRLGLKAHVFALDAQPFPFGDATFDGASCIEVFEHLFDPLFTAREIHRVLKPGASFVASVPNFGYFADRLVALLRAQVRNSWYDPKNIFAGAHIRFFGLRHFKMMLKQAGFEIVEVIPHHSCSIFDFLWVIGRFVNFSNFLKRHIPYALRLGFLEHLWPSMFAQHVLLVVRKP